MAVLKAFNWSPPVSKQGFIIKKKSKVDDYSVLNFKENQRSDFGEWIGFFKGQTTSGQIEGIAMFCPTVHVASFLPPHLEILPDLFRD